MRSFLSLFAVSLMLQSASLADSPTAVKQFPNLADLPDSSTALQKQIDDNNGSLILKAGVYRITRTLAIALNQKHSTIVRPASGPVTIIMDGPGPAIKISGSHQGSASPKSFEDGTWNELMPIVEGIQIVGNHPEADGITLFQCVQPIITKVSVRWCRHGIHLVTRNRNVTISDCHLYENSGMGIFFDAVNIHQSNISNCHISHNRKGGIVIKGGNIRNIQISNCDIEGNMPLTDAPTKAANILLDVSGTPGDKKHSIAEVAITGCTIQHKSNYKGKEYESIAPGGANIRILGKEIFPINTVTISGNMLSDTMLNMEIADCYDITVTGNNFFAPNPDNLIIKRSKRIIVNGNTFNPREVDRPGRIILEECRNCIVSNSTFHNLNTDSGAIVLRDCQGINLSSNIMSNCKSGVSVKNSRDISINNWTVTGLPEGVNFLTQLGKCSNVNIK